MEAAGASGGQVRPWASSAWRAVVEAVPRAVEVHHPVMEIDGATCSYTGYFETVSTTSKPDLFHAARAAYSPNQKLGHAQAIHAVEASARAMDWVNTRIDAGAPPEGPLRASAVFAFADLEQCRAYASAQDRQATWRYYRVRSEGAEVRAPFALSNHLHRLGPEHPCVADLVREYWRPSRTWSVLEYVLEQVVVLEEVAPEPDPLGVMASSVIIALGEDQCQAAQLWPITGV